MESVTSPELQALFQECPRLVRKLSSQEIRGLSNYVERRVQNDYADLLKTMTYLEMSRDNAERKLSRAMDSMQRESEKDRTLAEEYKRSYGNIAQVLSNKEVRFEGKYEDLVKELRTLEEDYETLKKTKSVLVEDIEKKNLVIEDLYKEIAQLKETIEERANHKDLQQEVEKMRREVLRLKFDLDAEKKEKSDLLREVRRLQDELTTTSVHTDLKPLTDSKLSSQVHKALPMPDTSTTKHVRISDRFSVVPSHSILPASRSATNTPSSPGYYCSASDCRARRDLDDCRSQLAKKCQENAYLSHLLAQVRTNGVESLTVRNLGLDYYQPRSTDPCRKSYRTSSTTPTYGAKAYNPASSVTRATSAGIHHASLLRNRPTYR